MAGWEVNVAKLPVIGEQGGAQAGSVPLPGVLRQKSYTGTLLALNWPF